MVTSSVSNTVRARGHQYQQPLVLDSVHLSVGPTCPNISTVSDTELHLARAVLLTFTTQKNGVEKKVIKMGLRGDLCVCVVKAVTRRVCHLQYCTAPPTPPLSHIYKGVGRHTQSVNLSFISKMVCDTVDLLGINIGFMSGNVSARSLQTASKMALLIGKVDPDIIQILGRWQLDKMFCYLHLLTETITKDFAAKMLSADYKIAPSQLVLCH